MLESTVHSAVVVVLEENYSAKPAQRSSHTGPPGSIGWDTVPACVDCRLAGLYSYTAERGS
jgi:hypothetical protein